MKSKRIHLATKVGGRSRCRYTSRVSSRAIFVPLERFQATAPERRCVECSRVLAADLATATKPEGGETQR